MQQQLVNGDQNGENCVPAKSDVGGCPTGHHSQQEHGRQGENQREADMG